MLSIIIAAANIFSVVPLYQILCSVRYTHFSLVLTLKLMSVILSALFWKWRNWGLERLRNLPKVSQLSVAAQDLNPSSRTLELSSWLHLWAPPPVPGSALQPGFINASFLHSRGAWPGVDHQCSPSPRTHLIDLPPWAQCVPSGSSLEPKWLCVWGPCDCADKRGTQKLYLLKEQNWYCICFGKSENFLRKSTEK